MYEVRYNVIVTDARGQERWVTAVVRATEDMTVSEIEQQATDIADEATDEESTTGGAVRTGYTGDRIIQVGGIVPL